MSENWPDGVPNEGDGIKNLRKVLKELKQKNADQEAQLAQLLAQSRKSSVNEALASRGLDPRVAKFYPNDKPTDDESVDAWVSENRELFGTVAPPPPPGNPDPTATTVSEAARRGYDVLRDIQAAEAATTMDLQSRINAIQYDPLNPEAAQKELLSVLANFDPGPLR